MRTPEISAVLPTRNRAKLLPRVFAGLWKQTLSLDRFEIIVVDDGSSDDTQEVVAALGQGLPIRTFRQDHAGLAAAKNLGIFAATAPLVLFLDDDDVPHHRLLETHIEAHQRHPDPAVAILGRTVLDQEISADPLMRHVTEVGCQLFAYGLFQPGEVLDYSAFWGGRSSCKRLFLVERDIFDPRFTFGCEDIELGWRLGKRGLRVIYEPRALSTMIRSIEFDDFCDRSRRQGRSQWRFHEIHPLPEVRAYCEIDACVMAWRQNEGKIHSILHRARLMHHTASIYAARSVPLEPSFQHLLDEAYRQAFFLCRAQGLVEFAEAQAWARPHDLEHLT